MKLLNASMKDYYRRNKTVCTTKVNKITESMLRESADTSPKLKTKGAESRCPEQIAANGA